MIVNRSLLLAASKRVALSKIIPENAPNENLSAANWRRLFHRLTSQGWSLGWIRCIRQDMLLWRVEASKDGIHHVVQGDDITAALVELNHSILGSAL